jgi:hypothetical protein
MSKPTPKIKAQGNPESLETLDKDAKIKRKDVQRAIATASPELRAFLEAEVKQ